MAEAAAYELYVFVQDEWHLSAREEGSGGRDRAIERAEKELGEAGIGGAVVIRLGDGPDGKAPLDSRVFRRFKRDSLPPLETGRTMVPPGLPPRVRAPGQTDGTVARTKLNPAPSRERPARKVTRPAAEKEDKSLLSLVGSVFSLITDGKPAKSARPVRENGPAEVPPLRFARYDILGELGKGAMGVVYKAFDPVIERTVALKTINKRFVDDRGEALARLRREAQSAGRLSHPNIVAIYDYGETEDVAFIAMEYVDGKTLADLLRDGPPDLPETTSIMAQILAALDYSHDKGVVHRDIKPANVMLLDSGMVKITDFGIARIEASTMTQSGTFLGTPAYMSPEQVMGKPADARSDIFSAGVVMYEMLAGNRPFDGAGATLVYQILNATPTKVSQANSNMPLAVNAVVEKATAKKPDDRYQTAKEFAHAITGLGGKAVRPQPKPEQTTQKKPWYERTVFEAGQEIFREGEEGDGCYVIESGTVEVVKTDEHGKDVVLATVGRGQVIGEMALIDNQRRMATVRAKEDTVLLQIPRGAFQTRLERLDPVTKRLLDTLSQRVRQLSEEIVRLRGTE